MAKVYKVWIEIEEYDEETGNGVTLPLLDCGSSGTFDTEEEAREHALKLHSAGSAAPDWTE